MIGDAHVHFARARIAQELHDSRRRRTADDRVVDDDDAPVLEILDDRIEFQLDAAVAHRLIRTDERPPDVAILDQPLDVRQAGRFGKSDAAGNCRVWDRHDDVGVGRMLLR